MMNRRGQTLIVFVLIIPIFILLLAFVVDTGFILKEYTKLNSITKMVLKNTYQKRLDDDYTNQVISLLEKNNIPIQNIEIIASEKEVIIRNSYYIDSIFGKIIGLKNYEIKSSGKATIDKDKLIIKKE